MADPEFINATLKERRDSAKDLGVFVFEPEQELSWVSGQYCTLGIMEEDMRIERPYSLASASYEKRLELFVELVLDGGLSPLLWKLKIGDTVTVRPKIRGKFTLDVESGRKTHFMVSTVTGAAPYVSMIRHHKEHHDELKSAGHRFFMIHGGSRSNELTYVDELNKIQADADWLTYVPTVSRPQEDPDWRGETGRVEDVIRKYFDQLDCPPSGVTAYLCGHPGMIETARGILARAGMQKELILEEQYFPAAAS